MALDQRVSVEQFDEYLQRTTFRFCNPFKCSDDRPSKCIGIFGPPNMGKSEVTSSLNAFIRGIRQSTMRNGPVRRPTPICASFATDSGMDWAKLLTFNSLVFSSPGRHFMAFESHRIFESKELMDLCDYKVALTGTEQTLMNRKRPPTRQSFGLFVARVKSFLRQVNSDKNMLQEHAQVGCQARPIYFD